MFSAKGRRNNDALSFLVLVSSFVINACQGQIPPKSTTNDGDYNTLRRDGSYDFGYNNNDEGGSYHISQANRNNVVRGRFGARDPGSKLIKETIYTAGPRGFRARGPNIHRKMDLDQRPRGPIGNKDDPYFDPNEDPSYSFGFKTATYEKQEAANRLGDVTGRYSYIDDVGERHNVEYIAGKNTGFHVRSAYPDSTPGSLGPLYYNRPLVKGEKKPRGHTSIQRGTDGSYRFISAGPDQRRSESSDANGNVRGSYTFLDDKGVQRTVHYIAGPGIGYRVIKSSKDPFVPSFFPSLPDYRDPTLDKPYTPPGSDFVFPPTKDDGFDDLFGGPGGSAASGHVKPPPNNTNKKPSSQGGQIDDIDKNDIFDNDGDSGFNDNNNRPSRPERPKPVDSDFGGQNQGRPTIIGDGDDDDIFGKPIDLPTDEGIPSSGTGGSTGSGGLGGTSSKPGGYDDEDVFGPSFTEQNSGNRPGEGGRPSGALPGSGRPSGNRPIRPTTSRPTGRPGYGVTGPDTGNRPGGDANGGENSGYGGGGRPGSGSGNRPGSSDNRPSSGTGGRPGGRPGGNGGRPTSGRPGYNGKPGSNGRPNGSGFRPGSRPGPSSGVRPGTRPDNGGNVPGKETNGYGNGNKKPGGSSFLGEDDEDVFGPKPPTGDGDSSFKPDVPSTGYDGPKPDSADKRPTDSGYLPETTSTSRPSYRPDNGSYRPTKPSGSAGSTGITGNENIPSTTPSGFLDETDEDLGGGYPPRGPSKPSIGRPSSGTQINITGHKDRHRYGTIFRNLGEESINFPPGASVRAHVQSIDLLPLKPKSQSPGEAVEEELKKHGSR